MSSIFTSESGEWKLGGFDTLSSMNDDEAIIYVGPPVLLLSQLADLRCRTAAALCQILTDMLRQKLLPAAGMLSKRIQYMRWMLTTLEV